MRRLLLVRHGETAWNAEGRVQGSSDISLSEAGLEQTKALAAYLAGAAARFDAVFTSDLDRAVQTARILRDATSSPEPLATGLLREICCGRWEGWRVDDLKRDSLGEYDRWRADSRFAVTGGESVEGVRHRVARFFEESAGELERADQVLLVGHGILNRMVLSHLMGLDTQRARFFGQDNTALNIFEFREGTATCTAWNVRPHMDGDAPLLPPIVPGALVGGEI